MISETFKADSSDSVCFTFWYHALGSTVGALRVFKADENVTNSVNLWEINGKQSMNDKDWKKGMNIYFQIIKLILICLQLDLIV